MLNSYMYDEHLRVDLNSDTLDVVKHVMCGIFNGDINLSQKVTSFLTRALSIKEMPGPYKLLYTIIHESDSVHHMVVCKDSFDEELLQLILSNGIGNMITRHSWEFTNYIRQHDLEYNLDSPLAIEEFSSYMYGECVRLYHEICSMKIDQVEAYLEQLSEMLRALAAEKMVVAVSKILTSSLKVGKEYKTGSKAALEVNREMQAYILEKYSLLSSVDLRYEMTPITSYNDAAQLRYNEVVKRGKDNFEMPLYNCGFGIMDVNVLVGDIFVIVGEEGVGKTTLLAEQVYYALKSGANVLTICTETAKLQFLHMVYSRHIYAETGERVSSSELIQFPKLIEMETDARNRRVMEEDYSRFLDLMDKMHSSDFGTLTLMQSASYNDMEDNVLKYKKNHNGAIIAIDSVSFLDSIGRSTDKENLDNFMKLCERMSTDEGMTFIMTTHDSSDTNRVSEKNKEKTGVRIAAGSGHVTKIAKLVIYVHTTKELAGQDRFIFTTKKVRGRAFPQPSQVIMLRDSVVSHYDFREELQASTSNIDDISDAQKYLDN